MDRWMNAAYRINHGCIHMQAITQHNPDLDEAPLSIKLKVRQSLNLYRKNKSNHGDNNKNNKIDKKNNNNNNNNNEAGDAKKNDTDVNNNSDINSKENNVKEDNSDNNTTDEKAASVMIEAPVIKGDTDVQPLDDKKMEVTEKKIDQTNPEPTTTVTNGGESKLNTV